MNKNKGESSRLRRKLTLYFILISIVSISVSAEIIFEFSSGKLQGEIRDNFVKQAVEHLPKDKVSLMDQQGLADAVGKPITDLRNRMILLLLVVFASIIGAFVMFTKDIVSPMNDIVKATKKIADGDLTVKVPVLTDDEIGQIAMLINHMNLNLQEMITEIRREISKNKIKLDEAVNKISAFARDGRTEEVLESRKMKLSDFRGIVLMSAEVVKQMESMVVDLGNLETFMKMYKTYAIQTEIKQKEIGRALDDYRYNSDYEDGE